ncbi:MAG: amidohydrolase, partial [Phototrophicales bacterium]
MIDTILYNGDIVTLDPKTPRVSALAIHGEYIVAWGSDDEIRSLATPKTHLYNLHGRMVIPGLTDAHLHWSWTAQSLRMVDLFEVPTKHEALQRVASHIQNVSPEEWVTGRGWTQDIW